MRQQIYSLLVDNNPGVLSRIAGLFSRRGYSIDSITAGITPDSNYTKITVVTTGEEQILAQIENQVRKLEDVREITMLGEEESVARELIMVKLGVEPGKRSEIVALADIFRAKVVHVGAKTMIIELTGNYGKLEGFLDLLEGYEVLELARTGLTALSRDEKEVLIDAQ